ncbi:hypothetical protein Sta7437_1047 [Stanieria cyanosphaera PCC 7437]|uniref:Glycosyltransferase RgtA/B/C/D-like domain-containing protein n=1 Tax=Stanieria cyanosphaera (strain ATCC 29371 / PCC 7437) TaxID=111780 RepID=K9XSI7_STAC7|nr:hypothetical protein [Stanieria cyanosphaera]AFZ34627.1 hypothetical protein Sta7437_1047 [Stanieria cyanosphaera PCC 7437]
MTNNKNNLWFGLSLLVTFYFGLISLHYVVSNQYIIQDDARQHLIWLQRLVEPQLFKDDLIINYFESVAPIGYKFFYWFWAKLGIAPIELAKTLPLILAIITTIYIYKVTLQIFPLPLAGFWSSLFVNQLIWLNDDLVSASPRAFIYPLFSAFLYYLIKQKIFELLIAIALIGLIYPQVLLIELTILTIRLVSWQTNSIKFCQTQKDYFIFLAAVIIACPILFIYATNKSEFSPVVTSLQMQQMPEFGLHGRSQYFVSNPILFFLNGSSGLSLPIFPTIVWISLSLPWLLKSQSPLVKLIHPKVKILWEVLLASLLMFILAHLLLPKLHLPSRYTYHSFKLVMAIASGVVLVIWLDYFWQWFLKKNKFKTKLISILVNFSLATIIIFPAIPVVFLVWFQNWQIGQAPVIYQFLSSQPPDTLVASLTREADNIPAFSFRSVLVGREFALAYHTNYYQQFKQRVIDLIKAQSSPNSLKAKQVIQKYSIDYWLVENDFFQPDYLFQYDWLNYSSFHNLVNQANTNLKQGEVPALAKLIKENKCISVATQNLTLLNAECILKQSN